jgi:hypothetical protein
MRRSVNVSLTLLPVLASAAVASADSLYDDPPPVESMPTDSVSPTVTPAVSPPGLTPPISQGVPPPDPGRELGPQDQIFMPPGLTPTVDEVDCDDPALPYWEYQVVCEDVEVDEDVVVRGGFGTYFWSGGG